MDIIGLDVHKRESRRSMKADDGPITDRRIVTSRERFTAVLGARTTIACVDRCSTAGTFVRYIGVAVGETETTKR